MLVGRSGLSLLTIGPKPNAQVTGRRSWVVEIVLLLPEISMKCVFLVMQNDFGGAQSREGRSPLESAQTRTPPDFQAEDLNFWHYKKQGV